MMLRSNGVREPKLAPDLATCDEQNNLGCMCVAERKFSDTANIVERLYSSHAGETDTEKIRHHFQVTH